MASRLPDKLFGVRDAFYRYFRDGQGHGVPVTVLPRGDSAPAPLPLTDEAILNQARARVRRLAAHHDGDHTFCVGTEAGLVQIESEGERRFLVRTWSVIRGMGEETWGASGSVQIPERVIAELDALGVASTLQAAGTRRHGGMVAALTAGLEDRRSATALATLHALASLFHGILDHPPGRSFWRPSPR